MNKRVIYQIFVIVFFIAGAVISSCSRSGNSSAKLAYEGSKSRIMVYAAASLTDVLTEIIDSFEIKNNIRVITNMASSGTLARQIEQGGTPDVYISASKKWADYVEQLEVTVDGYKNEIAKNELVLITPLTSTTKISGIDSSSNIISLLGDNRLSIGNPLHVPAGKYAKQSLEYYGWFSALEKKILPAKDVRSALMVVEIEEVPLGVVYKTDAQKSEKVNIIGTFPEKSHKPIVYVAEVLEDNKSAKNFFAYLSSDKTWAIWEKYGFIK